MKKHTSVDQQKHKITYSGTSVRKLGILIVMMWAVLQGGFGPQFLSGPKTVAAQTSDENWTTPVNLSHSGAATNPQLVISSDGVFHVIWSDQFSGTIYTSGDGTQWSDPLPVTLPFGIFRPLLLADSQGSIHAFWLDDLNVLFYSRVLSENFARATTWLPPQRMAANAVDMSVAMDASGRLHLTYLLAIGSEQQPPGVYYQQSTPRGQGWTRSVLLYESPYFRSLTIENANVKIATDSAGPGEKLYVTWDNPARERVFFTRSIDSGATWEEPVEVDAPIEGAVAGGPAGISVKALGDQVLLIWQTNRSTDNCSQYYQWSMDGGSTWGSAQPMLEDLRGCPQENQILVGQDGTVFLMTNIFRQIYLLSWDGTRWSSPQPQLTLSRFNDPETFKPVDFGCREAALVGGRTLFVVGCDTAGGQDIWITSRLLEDVSSWFSLAPIWDPLASINRVQVNIANPALITDSDGRVHLFWSQADPANPEGLGNSIYYARMEAGEWSEPLSILNLPEGVARQPAAAIDAQGHLYAVWSGGEPGQLSFSQASVTRAVIAAAWSEPVALPSPQPSGSSPDILVDFQGRIYVTYAIPLNEQRGIYLVRSDDGGQTWTDPVLVFDAARAGWAMVDRPRLALSGNGRIHLLWTQYSLPGTSGPLALFYAHSDDGGQSWSQAQMVSENPVVWSRVIAIGEQTVHRVWQELSNGRATLWHEWSLDGGITWERISPASIFGDTVGEPALTSDRVGRLHLLQIVSRGPNNLVLQSWLWDGSNWQADMNLDLSSAAASSLGDLVAAVSNGDLISVAFSGKAQDLTSGVVENSLFFTSRQLEVPADAATPPPPSAPTTAPPTPTPIIEPDPSPTPTPLAAGGGSLQNGPGLPPNPDRPGNAWLGSIIGPIIAGLIVLVVFIFGIRRFGSERR